MKIISLFFSLLMISCNAQNSIETNKVFQSSERKVGIKASNGDILIEPIYQHITPISKHSRLRLPPISEREQIVPELLEYYKVLNQAREIAIFDTNGKIVFDFCACMSFQIDEHTQTIVAKAKVDRNGYRSMIYSMDGSPLFEESFQEIGYINDSDLIALIKEDGANDEFYLYNPFTKKRIGPYDHFNIYNKDFDPTMGIKTIKFDPIIEPIGLSVRQNDTWGFVDMQGNELYPMIFDSFRYLSNDMQETYIKRSEKPENVEFMFYARLKDDRTKLVFFDKKMNEYSFSRLDSGVSKIELIEQ